MIFSVDNSSDDLSIRRVLALGFVPGTRIEVTRRAPFRDPTEYRLRGYRLCLRKSEASQIMVIRQAS